MGIFVALLLRGLLRNASLQGCRNLRQQVRNVGVVALNSLSLASTEQTLLYGGSNRIIPEEGKRHFFEFTKYIMGKGIQHWL